MHKRETETPLNTVHRIHAGDTADRRTARRRPGEGQAACGTHTRPKTCAPCARARPTVPPPAHTRTIHEPMPSPSWARLRAAALSYRSRPMYCLGTRDGAVRTPRGAIITSIPSTIGIGCSRGERELASNLPSPCARSVWSGTCSSANMGTPANLVGRVPLRRCKGIDWSHKSPTEDSRFPAVGGRIVASAAGRGACPRGGSA
eukprot:1183094-Prymnesium_polylepis.2